MHHFRQKYILVFTFLNLSLLLSVAICSLMFNEESDNIYPDALNMNQYTQNQKKILKRQLKHQETFLKNWCRPQVDNSTLNYLVCEGFQVEQEFILSTLSHLEQLEDDVAYTLLLLPNKLYVSSNNYVLARTSDIDRNIGDGKADDRTFHVAIFKDVYKTDNEEDYENILNLF